MVRCVRLETNSSHCCCRFFCLFIWISWLYRDETIYWVIVHVHVYTGTRNSERHETIKNGSDGLANAKFGTKNVGDYHGRCTENEHEIITFYWAMDERRT